MHAARWVVGASLIAIVAACQAGPSSTPVASALATASPEASASPASTASSTSPAASPASSASPSASASAPSSAPAADTILLRVDVVGGECPNGPCGAQFVLYGDGRVDGPPGSIQAITADRMSVIADQLGSTDWDAVRQVPFTGECPTAFDGQKHVYAIPAPGGDLVFDACEFDLSAVPLFQSIDEVLFAGG